MSLMKIFEGTFNKKWPGFIVLFVLGKKKSLHVKRIRFTTSFLPMNASQMNIHAAMAVAFTI